MKSYIVDSKMRARIRSAAQSIDPVLSVGKNALTPEFTRSVEEYMEKHEIMKINVLKNCDEDLHELGNTIAERSNRLSEERLCCISRQRKKRTEPSNGYGKSMPQSFRYRKRTVLSLGAEAWNPWRKLSTRSLRAFNLGENGPKGPGTKEIKAIKAM